MLFSREILFDEVKLLDKKEYSTDKKTGLCSVDVTGVDVYADKELGIIGVTHTTIFMDIKKETATSICFTTPSGEKEFKFEKGEGRMVYVAIVGKDYDSNFFKFVVDNTPDDDYETDNAPENEDDEDQ